jgi:hypothetical protein
MACRIAAVPTVFFQMLYLAIQSSYGRSDTGFELSLSAPLAESPRARSLLAVEGVRGGQPTRAGERPSFLLAAVGRRAVGVEWGVD